MLYHAYELTHAALAPMKALCEWSNAVNDTGLNPWAMTPQGRVADAACRWFDGLTRRYGRPDWDVGDGAPDVVAETYFCELARFRHRGRTKKPKVLLVAPLSGHYPTLLRGTAKTLIKDFDVYVTDWRDARMVPAALGEFGFDDYVKTILGFLRKLGPDVHVVAVCQPAVPVLVAVAHMARLNDPAQPRSMVLMGGPMDTRINPSAANDLAESRDIEWFERNVISRVPAPHPGAMRRVYPGFVQLSGFLYMNLERHVGAHLDYFNHLVVGDGDSAAQHKTFYEEFNAVMDLPAAFFLETVERVFQRHELPRGEMVHDGLAVEPQAIKKTRLMTVEGGRDDICPPGQTLAVHDLCSGLRKNQKHNLLHPAVGHYGVFNGRRWRAEIAPEVKKFMMAAADA